MFMTGLSQIWCLLHFALLCILKNSFVPSLYLEMEKERNITPPTKMKRGCFLCRIWREQQKIAKDRKAWHFFFLVPMLHSGLKSRRGGIIQT